VAIRAATQLTLGFPHEPTTGRADFVAGRANLEAIALIEAMPEWPLRGVLLVGPEGSGKSHLVSIWCEFPGAARIEAKNLDREDATGSPPACRGGRDLHEGRSTSLPCSIFNLATGATQGAHHQPPARPVRLTCPIRPGPRDAPAWGSGRRPARRVLTALRGPPARSTRCRRLYRDADGACLLPPTASPRPSLPPPVAAEDCKLLQAFGDRMFPAHPLGQRLSLVATQHDPRKRLTLRHGTIAQHMLTKVRLDRVFHAITDPSRRK
jgi:hypothetical protein